MKAKLVGIIAAILLIYIGLTLLGNPQVVPAWPRLSLPDTAGLTPSAHTQNRISISPTDLTLIGPAAPPEPEAVVPFVKELHFHGIPYDQARQFGPEAVPYLLVLLTDPANEPYGTNIVVTLGFIGHPSARSPLLDYLTQTRGEVTLDQFRSLTAVPYALAQLAHQGDVASLTFLLDASDPTYWTNQRLPWTYQGRTYETELYQRTLLALGVSGLPQAQARLAEIAGPGGVSALATDDTLQQALALNQRVQQEGMARVVTSDPNQPPEAQLVAESTLALGPLSNDTNSVGHLQTFKVGRYYSMGSPDDARVDDILNEASKIIQAADSPTDIACCVALQRNGPVGTFTNTDGTIDTSTDLFNVFGISVYEVKVVPALDYCGGYNPSIIGCSYVGSSKNMILEHLSSLTQNGILWAHEFGHNQGLRHPSPAIPSRIMNGYLTSFAKEMTQTECNAWHSTFLNPGTSGPCPFGFKLRKYLSGNSEVTANARITYTIKVDNSTFQEITGITVSDNLPAIPELTYIPGSATADPPGIIGDLTNFPTSTSSFDLNADESVSITYAAQVAGTVEKGDLLVNTATVSSADLTESVQASVTAIVDPDKIHLPILFR